MKINAQPYYIVLRETQNIVELHSVYRHVSQALSDYNVQIVNCFVAMCVAHCKHILQIIVALARFLSISHFVFSSHFFCRFSCSWFLVRDILGHPLGPPRHHWTSWNIQGHSGTSRDILEHPGSTWNIQGHPGTSRDILEHTGTSWNIQGQPGTSRDILEHPGTS